MSGTTGGPFLISTLPPSSNQRWLARVIVITLLVGFSVTVAFHYVQLRRYDAFVPIANTIICLNDVITAALLLVQFAMTRSRALLALAAGFLFTSLMMIPHALSFPGAFAPAGLLGAGLQTTAWLYMSQHMVFLLYTGRARAGARRPSFRYRDRRRHARAPAATTVDLDHVERRGWHTTGRRIPADHGGRGNPR